MDSGFRLVRLVKTRAPAQNQIHVAGSLILPNQPIRLANLLQAATAQEAMGAETHPLEPPEKRCGIRASRGEARGPELHKQRDGGRVRERTFQSVKGLSLGTLDIGFHEINLIDPHCGKGIVEDNGFHSRAPVA